MRTLGLNHVNLVVTDVDRSRVFYETALGFEFVKIDSGITFLTTPGGNDLLALQPSGGDLAGMMVASLRWGRSVLRTGRRHS